MRNWIDSELGLDIGSKDRQTDTQTNGRNQVHYLPTLLSYAVHKNEIYRKWFMLMAKIEEVDQW